MGNKFFVSIELFFCLIFYLVLGVSLLIWLAIEGLFSEDLYVIIIMIIMLLILPTVMLIYGVCKFCPKIELTAEGMTKYLCGIKLKSYKWEELKFFQFKGQFNQWVFFSKIDLSEKFLSTARCRKDNIYFFRSQKKFDIIKQVAPEYIIEQLDKKI